MSSLTWETHPLFFATGSMLDPSITAYGKRDSRNDRAEVGYSISIDDLRRDALDALMAIKQEASNDNWNEEGGKAVRPETIGLAATFLRLLPRDLPTPEVSPDPDGEIGFYWGTGSDKAVVASISPRGVISYASLYESVQTHGRAPLSDELPSALKTVLRELHRDG